MIEYMLFLFIDIHVPLKHEAWARSVNPSENQLGWAHYVNRRRLYSPLQLNAITIRFKAGMRPNNSDIFVSGHLN